MYLTEVKVRILSKYYYQPIKRAHVNKYDWWLAANYTCDTTASLYLKRILIPVWMLILASKYIFRYNCLNRSENPGAKHSGSMATKHWPRSAGLLPSFAKPHLLTLFAYRDPASIPQNISTIIPSPYPLYPPVSSTPPSGKSPPVMKHSSGSFVFSPDAVVPHPFGICSPFRRATSTLPSATVVVAMSRQKLSPSVAGAITQIGFVPNVGPDPRVGYAYLNCIKNKSRTTF